MAYNKKNHFLRVLEVQETFLLYKKEGVTTRHVYHTFIWPKYKISMSTFYNYMGINARKEVNKQQNDLFSNQQ